MAGEHYKEFIDNAYIAPIRSVLIVDDDYPTIEEILVSSGSADPANGQGKKLWLRDPKRVVRMIRAFRRKPTPLLVDVHDGSDIVSDTTMATHLHQCDLLVLDYQLEREKPGDGTRAMAVLRGAMANSHFNLVVIYTDEDLDVVFNAVRGALVAPWPDALSATDRERAQTLIDGAEDVVEGIGDKLSETIGPEQYFHARRHPKYSRMMMKGREPYAMFAETTERLEWNPRDRKVVLRYLLDVTERAYQGTSDSEQHFDDLEWSWDAPTWISSDASFVAFARKSDDDDLLCVLREALIDWCPPPSRLVLAKIRAEVDEHGVPAQRPALRDRHALAYWYHRLLLSDNNADRRWRISESVSRHADKLAKEILPNVEEFVADLIKAERSTGDPATICKEHFGVDLSDRTAKELAVLEHNTFVCSMEPTGWHLTAGHVFEMAGEHWLCVSPSCDMVPSQMSPWRKEIVGERIPFIGVILEEFDPRKKPNDISTNRFVFLQRDGEYVGYRFNYPHDSSAPRWEVLYADNRGQFADGELKVTVWRIQKGESTLVAKHHDANVVGQLRYEYALNLIQRLGVSLTRIGLDFTDIEES